ncbi:MAG: hypothetical protein DIU77_006990 [Thermocrispum agreste]|jgi:hypothetical protein|uniref:SH3b domain-containing protein n=1 Tax=Thermocrispum agreste TaxID=37925 RepID=A0A2W4JGH1_9PSEU|nr:MAG: hypothetical protein DIU77_08170 [Thermocrispum agreste]
MRGRKLLTAAVSAVLITGATVGVTAAPGLAAEPGTWALTPDNTEPDNRTIIESGGSWTLSGDLGRQSADWTTGTLTFPAKHMQHPVNRVAARVDAAIPDGTEVAVDVRGKRPDGTWSEWTEVLPDTPAVLPNRTKTVQARLVLTAPPDARSPQVARIELSASYDASAKPTAEVAGPAEGYRVFATREGLVGGTTANGHVIVARDHFVALPSRRGLADKNSGNYTVQVCTENGARCEWAPVWDVGPWNTKDDYWNPNREMWQDLPQGKPEAQAAYLEGYNGGKDQFGRKVANPAGIDLADGTFWDGLGFTDNGWVIVTYEWTVGGPWGTVATSGPVLNVRAQPNTSSAVVGLAAKYAQVRIECAVKGQVVEGNDTWFRINPGKYISAAYVRVGQAPPAC